MAPQEQRPAAPTRKRPWDPFVALCEAHGLPVPEREWRFAPPRRWRFDYAFPAQRITVEQEGGVWTAGRHTRGRGFEADCVKYAEATLRGWRVFRASPRQMRDGTVIGWLRRMEVAGVYVEGVAGGLA